MKVLDLLQNQDVQTCMFWSYFISGIVLYLVGKYKRKTKVKDAGKWMLIGGGSTFLIIVFVLVVLMLMGFK